MELKLITLGHKTPTWIQEGFIEYQSRINQDFSLKLIELPLKNHGKLPQDQAKKLEGELLLKEVKLQDFCITLDEHGKELTTEALAKNLELWQREYRTISLLVGGPTGLSKECFERANFKWSLSQLTFPHQMIKIIIAEQMYRAISILKNHPYHRP